MCTSIVFQGIYYSSIYTYILYTLGIRWNAYFSIRQKSCFEYSFITRATPFSVWDAHKTVNFVVVMDVAHVFFSLKIQEGSGLNTSESS